MLFCSADLINPSASASPKRDPTLQGYEPLESQRNDEPPRKSPLGIEPLDTRISLPPKIASLDFRTQSNASSFGPDNQEGSLQAYQPNREGA